jgi:hypothetical protein
LLFNPVNQGFRVFFKGKENNIQITSALRLSYFFCAIALCFLFVSITAAKISNFDFWWHLKTGEWILENHAFPTSDPFSLESVSGVWHNGHGLFQLTLACIHAAFGINVLTVFQILCGVFFFALIFLNSERNVLWFPLFLIAFLCLGRRFMLRPELFTFGFVLAYVLILSRPKKQSVLCLPILQIFFANSHSAFLLGPVLLFLKAFASCFSQEKLSPRFYFFVLGLTVLACVVSPLGVEGFWFSLTLIPKVLWHGDVYKNTILEFAPPQWFGSDFIYFIYFLVLLVFLISWVREKNIFAVLVALFFGVLAMQATRNFNVLLFVSLPLIGCSPLFSKLAERMPISFKLVIVAGVAVVALQYSFLFASNTLYYQQNRLERFGVGFNECVFSKNVPEFLKKIRGDLKIFNTMSLGGYLIYHAPHLKVFFDGRLEAYSEAHYKTYLKMAGSLDFFLQESEKRGINLVLINHSINEGAALMQLGHVPGWTLNYLDAFVAVFVKEDVIRKNPWMREFDLQKSYAQFKCEIQAKAPREQELEMAIFHLALEAMGVQWK